MSAGCDHSRWIRAFGIIEGIIPVRMITRRAFCLVVRGRQGILRAIDDVFAAMWHRSFFCLIVRIASIQVDAVLSFARQLNDKGDDVVLFIVFVFNVFVQGVAGRSTEDVAVIAASGGILIGVEFSVKFQQFGTLEFDQNGQMSRFENRLLMRQRSNIEMTNRFSRTPFTRCTSRKRMLERKAKHEYSRQPRQREYLPSAESIVYRQYDIYIHILIWNFVRKDWDRVPRNSDRRSSSDEWSLVLTTSEAKISMK